ncbi:hypothetical protein H5V45_17020 [Nocardioides sp. KIGAM211]|uniref:Phospholipase D-like domain-containing protein n=1 Tax=Nocardioides luti TaxID=2761101 RepID=A0A7X0RIP5_9ACTN|nr:phospholipase D-like domain-containing protein [Nocardioides luti]MBB6629031.1 hypothetical protein [Nocardioides luti]
MTARTIKLFVALLVCVGLVLPAQAAVAAEPKFTPRSGVTFNNPLGDAPTRNAIFNKITRSIDGSPKGSNIRIFTWNFLTRVGVDALLRAQRRGVQVELLMAKSNTTEIDNRPFRRLKNSLKAGNAHRKKSRYSYAKVCDHSCRGTAGTSHSKFYLFSQVGKAKHVYMQGSANYTVAAATNQWNDLYTHTGQSKLYRFARKVFEEASRDKPVKPPYAVKDFGLSRIMFFPDMGKDVPDPVMSLLNKVSCRGATNTASNRTVLRLAPDVIRNERGMRIAKKLRSLWEKGCDIHIGYTVLGVSIARMLRDQSGRGPVPLKHLVQDANQDGEFDNYFHLKAMSIVGHIGKNRGDYMVLNGSANLSGLARGSDENLAIYHRRSATLKYQSYINYWYDNFPSGGSSKSSPLMFGAGPDYVLEGESASAAQRRPFVNPFAHVDMD